MEHDTILLNNQIESMADNLISNFLDAYQCIDWGITPTEFAKRLADQISKVLRECAEEMENEEK